MDNALLRRIYLAGSDDLRMFGGLYQGAYYLQQVPEEAAEFITLCRSRCRKNPRLLDDELVCRSVRVIDDNKHPQAGWRPFRLPHSAGEYIGNAADAGPWLVGQGEQYDLAIIDTDHTYANERRHTEVVLPHLAAGGLLAYHDSVAAAGDGQMGQLILEMKAGLYPDLEHLADIGSRLGLAVFRRWGEPAVLPDYQPPATTLLYHFCPWAKRPEMIEFHLRRLGHYLPQFSKVRINIVTGNDFVAPKKIEDRLRPCLTTDDVQFFHTPGTPATHGEVVPFFTNLLPAVGPDENVCYGHTKAAVLSGLPGGKAWAEFMYAHVMQNSRAACAMLKTKTTCGTFFRTPVHRGADWHYAGTFFWFRNVQRWPRWQEHETNHRYGVEAWLGRFLSRSEAVDLHCWPFLRGLVRNRGGILARWCQLPEW